MAVMFVRVQDPDTRHEFDLPETHPFIASGLVRRVKVDRYPPSPVIRPPKYYMDLAAIPSAAPKRQPAKRVRTTTPKEHARDY
jgi:hypothetical protein